MSLNVQTSPVLQLGIRPDKDPATSAAASTQFNAVLHSVQNSAATTKVPPTAKAEAATHATHATDGSKQSNALKDFLEYMHQTPEQRLRAKLLLEMNLTEEEIKAMPPAVQFDIEQKIAKRMAEEIEFAKVTSEQEMKLKSEGMAAV